MKEHHSPQSDMEKMLVECLSNRIHVALIWPQRFQNTSFIFNLLKKFESEKYVCPFIDIFNITSHREFLQQILPKLSAASSRQISFEKSSGMDLKWMIQDILEGIANLGEKVVVVINEFQKIAEIDDKGWLEATLRTHMQQLRNTSFLFTGSNKSLIYDMLNNSSRPLFRSCQLIDFGIH
jgi:hypothetical protein